MCQDLRVRIRLPDGLGVVWPTGREGSVAFLLEHRRPAVPTARQQPEAVDEDDRFSPRRVCALDLPGLVLGDRGRAGRRKVR